MRAAWGPQASARAPRLYLVTPPLGDAGAIADDLADALNATDIAAVLVRLEDGDERCAARADQDAAHPDPERTVRRCCSTAMPGSSRAPKADGAHLTGTDALQGRGARASSRNTLPAAAGSRPATTPCWLANRGPTTSCSASRTRRPPAGLRRRARARRLVGGNFDRFRASAMRQASTRSRRSRARAPISSRSARRSGATAASLRGSGGAPRRRGARAMKTALA